MKRLLVALVLALSLAANAEWKKVGGIQVADVNSLITGVTKLGEFTGNPMLGLMASSSVTKLPFIRFFGPGREKTPLALIVFYNDRDFEYAVLFPVAQTQEEFLKRRPGTVDAEGVIELKKGEPDEIDGDDFEDFKYVAFSKDGKWAAVSDKREQARLAILETALAEKPMDGDLIRIGIGPNGMALIRKAIEVRQMKEALGAEEKSDHRYFRDVLSECEALVCGASVDDRGLAIHSAIKAQPGSRVARCGLEPLGANPLAFAKRDAIGAYAQAKDSGQAHVTFADVQKFFGRQGLKMDYLTAEDLGNGVSRFTLDIPAAVAYFKGATNEIARIDTEKFNKDFTRLVDFQDTFRVENPSMAGSFAIKGYTTVATPAERVANVLPEIAGKKPYQLQVFSIYALVKAIVPHALAAMDADDRVMFQAVLAALPPEGNGGIASALWREGDTHRFLLRVSGDEFKCVSAGFSALLIHGMQQAQQEKAQQEKAPSAK